MAMRPASTSVFSIFLIVGSLPLSGQQHTPISQSGAPADSFSGHIVASSSHGAIANAEVELRSAGGSSGSMARTDAEGRFKLALPQGARLPLQLLVRAPGFQDGASALSALPSRGVNLEISLDVAGGATAVTVSGETPPLEQQTPVISQVVSGAALDRLPENGRSLTKLALLDPQVRNTVALGGDSSTNGRLNINADIFRFTRYTVDGSTNYEVFYGNGPLMLLPISGVAGISALTNQYDVGFGGTTTGIIAYGSRSGDKDFHGAAGFFGRPSGLQAAPPVATVRPPNRLLDGYGRLGGPLFSPRTHAFASYEQDSFRRGSFIQSPAPSVYLGDGSDFYTLARLDHQISGREAFSLRVNGNRTYTDNPNDVVGGLVQASAGQTNRSQAAAAQLSLTSTFGGKTNAAQFQFVHAIPTVLTPNQPSVVVVRPGYSTSGYATYIDLKTLTEDFRDVLAWTQGQHTLQIGVEGTRTQVDYSTATPFGTYTFASGAPTPGQQPTTYNQMFGVAKLRTKDSFLAGFIEDAWHAGQNLTLTLGSRYEYQGFTGDRNNIAPRLGVAYNVAGAGRTVLRAGFGYFFGEDFLALQAYAYQGSLRSPFATYTFTAGQPGFPSFPNNLLSPLATGLGNRDLYLLPQHLLNPYNMQATLGVEQSLGEGWTLSASGIHAITRKQLSDSNLNPPTFMRTAPGQVLPAANRPLSTYEGVGVNNIIQVGNGNSTAYDALRVDLLHHGGKLLDWNTSYIYAAALTYSVFQGEGTIGAPNDWNHPKAGEYGPTDFNQRHRSVSYGTLHLPWRSQLTGVVTAAAGLPVNPITGVDNNKDGFTTDRPVGLSRDSFRGPRQFSLDLSAGKLVRLSDRVSTDLRLDAFNLTNYSNFLAVNNVYGNGAAPASTFLSHLAGLANADPGRQLQFGAEVNF